MPASPLGSVIDTLLNYEQEPDDVDDNIGKPEYVAVTTRGQFAPNTVINDARQRELFRMVHSRRPLQEKMALFWHNHFATAYSKVNGTYGSVHATKMMAGRPDQVAGSQRGQYQLFRDLATGNFRELLVEVARDPAMLVWLDGRNNTRARPQENFGREIMELFTHRHRQLHRSGRLCRGARVHRAGACGSSGDRATPETVVLRVRLTTPGSTTPTAKDVHVCDLSGRRQDHSGAARRRRGCRTASTSSAALARHPATAHRLGAQAVSAISSARSPRLTKRVISDARERLHAERRQHQAGAAARCSRPRRFSAPSSRATRGRSSSSCDRSRRRAGTGCRWTRR